MFKLVLEKAEEPEIKLPSSTGSSKKQENSRRASTSALLTMPKPLILWITTNWKILKEMGIPDHLTYLLRNLHAGQEAAFRTGHGTTDWFQIGKGDQIANKHWIIEKAKEFQKKIYFCFIDCAKAFDCVDHSKLENSSRDGYTRPSYLTPEKPVCRSRSSH